MEFRESRRPDFPLPQAPPRSLRAGEKLDFAVADHEAVEVGEDAGFLAKGWKRRDCDRT